MAAEIQAEVSRWRPGEVIDVPARMLTLSTPDITDAEISDQVMTFFFAASETTANAVAWALFLLAGDEQARRRWHAKSSAVLAGRPVEHGHLDGLRFTGWVVAEALRLYPPVWLVTRILAEDTELGGHRLPAGTTVACSPYLIHRTDFARPDRFDPDRWRDTPAHTALAFGAGARKCIGHQFALAEATMTLAAIGARWRLEPVARARPAVGLSLRPSGLLMRATEPTA